MLRRTLMASAGALGVVLSGMAFPAASTAVPRTGSLSFLAAYDSQDGEAGAEIVAFDAETATMLVTNGARNRIDVISLATPSSPALQRAVDLSPYGAGVQSVATRKGIGVAVVTGATVLDPGTAVFFDIATGAVTATAPTGVLPDGVAWDEDGEIVVVANEGEPRCVTGPGRVPTKDPLLAETPEGSVTVIEVDDRGRRVDARQVSFERFNSPAARASLLAKGVRVGTWPGSTVAQDLEPEYPVIDGDRAYVTLQENNAIAVIDLDRARVLDILPLGTKDHSQLADMMDASDRDGAFRPTQWPVRGVFMPDAISHLEHRGKDYLVTANEGDARTYYSGIDNEEVDGQECFIDEARVRSLPGGLDPASFGGQANVDSLRDNTRLGRLKVMKTAPSVVGPNGKYTSIASYGGRSMSVWSSSGQLVWDSGRLFEQVVRAQDPDNWVDDGSIAPWATDPYDTRSDDKGVEPEAVTVGEHRDRHYAFVGLERAGGVVVLDVTDPRSPSFLQWVRVPGQISPEGITFVPASKSPNKRPLVLVAHEISGTTAVFELRV